MNLRSAQATVLLGTLALLVVVAGGWLVLVGPATGALGTTRTELVDTTDANRLLRTRLARLQAQRDDLGTVRDVAESLAVVAPPTADQPGFFALIDAAARAAGLRSDQVTTLSPTVPVALTAPAPPAGEQEAAPDGAAPATSATAATAATAAASAAPAPSLAVQSVTVAVEASYRQVRDLLAELERMERAFLVQSVALSGSEGEGGLVVTITGSTFVAPPVALPVLDDDQGSGTDEVEAGDAEAAGPRDGSGG